MTTDQRRREQLSEKDARIAELEQLVEDQRQIAVQLRTAVSRIPAPADSELRDSIAQLHEPRDRATSDHLYCDEYECDRAGEGELKPWCDACGDWAPCETMKVLAAHPAPPTVDETEANGGRLDPMPDPYRPPAVGENVVDFQARRFAAETSENLRCPTCRGEWWATPGVVVDQAGKVSGYGLPLACLECGDGE